MIRALIIAAVLLSAQADAQQVQLTLSCQIETVVDLKTDQETRSSGSFSAIVRMSNSQDATIEATTDFCFDYVGSFSEQQVVGECNRTVEDLKSKYWAYLTINRINGAFEHTFLSTYGSKVGSNLKYSGHCTPGKKLF